MKPRSSALVESWLNRQSAETLYLSAVSLSELLLGVALLPNERRKVELGASLKELVTLFFGPRILAFDQRAAEAYALLVSSARSKGTSISVQDGQIAATAKVHGFAVATRDGAPFRAAGIPVIDPWQV